jgi:hypothetical protein
MSTLLLLADLSPADVEWARWLRDVMLSWPVQLAIMLLWVGLAALLVRHARREWDGGLHNRYLQVGLVVFGAFLVAQFLLASSLVGDAFWPVWPFVVEFVVLFALWLYAFVRFMTTTRSGKGDEETRRRGAALDEVIAAERGGTA